MNVCCLNVSNPNDKNVTYLYQNPTQNLDNIFKSK